MDIRDRRTGRTTGLILQAIGKANLSRGTEVEFVDDKEGQTAASARLVEKTINKKIQSLGIRMSTRRDGPRVFVRSMM